MNSRCPICGRFVPRRRRYCSLGCRRRAELDRLRVKRRAARPGPAFLEPWEPDPNDDAAALLQPFDWSGTEPW